jgi:hypothetical protein
MGGFSPLVCPVPISLGAVACPSRCTLLVPPCRVLAFVLPPCTFKQVSLPQVKPAYLKGY